MKQKLLIAVMGVILALPAMARQFKYGYKGQTLTYTVISETDKTVETKEGQNNETPGNKISGSLVIPEKITDGENIYTVIKIGKNSFAKCKELTSVTIPNSVTSIGEDAFSKCEGMTGELIIPNAVTTIGPGAFDLCSGLTGELIIPNSVKTIGYLAFRKCSGLTSVEIPNSVTSIGDGAFYSCDGLKRAIFASPDALLGIEFEDYGSNPLYKANALYFKGNDSEVTEFTFPEGITSIPTAVLSGGSHITSVTIPNSVTSIGEYAFCKCSGLTGELIIPNAVTTIGESAFNSCTGLTGELIIPNAVTTIGESAFLNCTGLTSVSIPNSVTFIGSWAFGYCPALTSVYYAADKPIKGSSEIFWEGTYEKATLYTTEIGVIMAGTVDPWKNFVSIEEYDFSGIDEIVVDLDADAPYDVYNLNGVKVATDTLEGLDHGFYIVRQGRVAKKIAIK